MLLGLMYSFDIYIIIVHGFTLIIRRRKRRGKRRRNIVAPTVCSWGNQIVRYDCIILYSLIMFTAAL